MKIPGKIEGLNHLVQLGKEAEVTLENTAKYMPRQPWHQQPRWQAGRAQRAAIGRVHAGAVATPRTSWHSVPILRGAQGPKGRRWGKLVPKARHAHVVAASPAKRPSAMHASPGRLH